MKDDSKFLNKIEKRIIKIMKKINPEWDDNFLKDNVKDIIESSIVSPKVVLDNNYTHESRDASLISVFDWCYDRKPIITGNGTFYMQHKERLSPTSKLQDHFLINRDKFKGQMFAIPDNSSPLYKKLDLKQGNVKKLVNSYYGGSGMKQSAFYSKYSGPSTTLTAQSAISTVEQAFEGFFGDNYLFLDLTECLEWCEITLKKFNRDYESSLDEFISYPIDGELSQRLYDKIINNSDNDLEILELYCSSLTIEEYTVLFYTNNFTEFVRRHEYIKKLIWDIFDNIENLNYIGNDDELENIPLEYSDKFANKSYKDWNKFVNKSYFMNPNDIPDSISKYMFELEYLCMKYVYTDYQSFDRIYRLRNFTRDVVTVIDTDSNILSYDFLVDFLDKNVIHGESFGRSNMNNEFIYVNILSTLSSTVAKLTLDSYGKHSNVTDEFRGRYKMKNEFMFRKLIIGRAKKRYMSEIILREGNLMIPTKFDIKGFDFKKSTTSENVEKVFMKIIKDNILCEGDINVQAIINELYKFKESIKSSIREGNIEYLPNGNVKELDAYKNPATQASVRGTLAWNFIYKDNMIDIPSKVKLVKLKIFTPDDMANLKNDHKDIYDIIMDKIFRDNTNTFVEIKWVNLLDDSGNVNYKGWCTSNVPKIFRDTFKKDPYPKNWNGFVEEYFKQPKQHDVNGCWKVRIKGFQVLAIPTTEKIPEWVQPYIDINTMVNDILAPFNPVLDIFKFQTIQEGKNISTVANRKSSTITNIVKF